MDKFKIWLLASLWRYRSRKQCQLILKFLSLSGEKKKMVALIKELHRNNDGSYKSSNANLYLYIPCGYFHIQHKHGYIFITYRSNSGFGCKICLWEKTTYDLNIFVDFKEEAAVKLDLNSSKYF